MSDQDKEESMLSKFSNQDPAAGGYGEGEDLGRETPMRKKPSAAAKIKKKKKKKSAKQSRKKNRK